MHLMKEFYTRSSGIRTKASVVLEKGDFQKALSYLPEGGEKIMDALAEQWMEQGRNEGIMLGEIKKSKDLLRREYQYPLRNNKS